VLRRMPANLSLLIRKKIETVAQDPVGAQGVKKLSGRDGYRLGLATGGCFIFWTASGYECWSRKSDQEEGSINEGTNH